MTGSGHVMTVFVLLLIAAAGFSYATVKDHARSAYAALLAVVLAEVIRIWPWR